jgi:hypothetical protein
MTETFAEIREFYWTHRDVIRVAAAAGAVVLMQLVLVVWALRRLRELGHLRERLSRLADGLALLTDTTDAGLTALLREVERLNARRAMPAPRKAAPRPAPKRPAGPRVAAASAPADRLIDLPARVQPALADAVARSAQSAVQG